MTWNGFYIKEHPKHVSFQDFQESPNPRKNPMGSMGLVYLPTVTIRINQNAAKYTIQGWYGLCKSKTFGSI